MLRHGNRRSLPLFNGVEDFASAPVSQSYGGRDDATKSMKILVQNNVVTLLITPLGTFFFGYTSDTRQSEQKTKISPLAYTDISPEDFFSQQKRIILQ
jgi:hypothetical protein